MMETTWRKGGNAAAAGARSQPLEATTRRVRSASCRGEGAARKLREPDVWLSVYCPGAGLVFEPGCGSPGLGAVPRPLPFRTHRESPRVRIADGYHSTGMRPSRAPSPAAGNASAAL